MSVENDCQDQASVPTKTCTQCRTGFTSEGVAIFAPLVKGGRFWRCSVCGSSYGEHPHPDCERLAGRSGPTDPINACRQIEAIAKSALASLPTADTAERKGDRNG